MPPPPPKSRVFFFSIHLVTKLDLQWHDTLSLLGWIFIHFTAKTLISWLLDIACTGRYVPSYLSEILKILNFLTHICFKGFDKETIELYSSVLKRFKNRKKKGGGQGEGDLLEQNLPANAVDEDSIPGSGRSPREGNGNPVQYSCLENPMDREAQWARVHGGHKGSDMIEQLSTHVPTHGAL